MLDVLRSHVERLAPETAAPDTLAGKHWSLRWWRYRNVHRLFGWKFWCVVCGAAPLDPGLEAFWRKLGFLVVQGYGLTETAPIVTLNHPLRAGQGTVGRPIHGVEVRIAPDGEILVRGENVTKGYYAPESGGTGSSEPSSFEDGWFHTGDIGNIDETGRLLIKGRKKEMIVTPQGLNVFPEDVERALTAQPGVKDAAVVGLNVNGEERVHAVLVLAPDTDADTVVRGANARLEDHQRVWTSSIWPGASLPRTEGTQKLKRRDIQRWAAGGAASTGMAAAGGASVAGIVQRFAPGRDVSPSTTLEELGLSSLDRVELMMALEEAFQTTLEESALGGEDDRRARSARRRTGRVSGVPRSEVPGSQTQASSLKTRPAVQRPSSSLPGTGRARVAAPPGQLAYVDPSARTHLHVHEGRRSRAPSGSPGPGRVRGESPEPPGHPGDHDGAAGQMALSARAGDGQGVLQGALQPAAVRTRAWFTNSLNYYLSCQFFNAFPLPQREAGTRQTLRYIGEVIEDGYSVLIFPEGKRTMTGEIGRFMPGVGMIGARLSVLVVPVRLEGLDKVPHQKMKFPVRGPVRVAFGPPIRLSRRGLRRSLAKQVEDAVRSL